MNVVRKDRISPAVSHPTVIDPRITGVRAIERPDSSRSLVDLANDERSAARAAFRLLYRRGEVTEQAVQEAVYPGYPAGYASSREWWDGIIEEVFDSLLGVERPARERGDVERTENRPLRKRPLRARSKVEAEAFEASRSFRGTRPVEGVHARLVHGGVIRTDRS